MPLQLALHHHTMHPFRQESSCVENICQVICRREAPVTVFVHQEGKVLVVVIGIVCQDVEDHSAEHLLLGRFPQTHLAAYHQHLFVAVRVGVQSCQSLHMQFVRPVTVKTTGDEMCLTFNFNQPARHHVDSGSDCHLGICHLQLGRRAFGISEFQDAIFKTLLTGNLSASYFARSGVYCNDGFRLTSSGRGAHGNQ